MHKNNAVWATLLMALVIQVQSALAGQPPVITSATEDSATAGQSYRYVIAASSNTAILSYNATPLPTGLDINTTTGEITGSTTAVGDFNINLFATNASGTGTLVLKLTVNPVPPNISNPLSATGSVGVPFNFILTATGIPSPTFTAGPLPPGLSFSGNKITGTPLQAGVTFVTLVASNVGGTDTKTLTITITAPPVITSSLIVPGAVGQQLTYDITASNVPKTFSVVGGTFPAGISNLTVNPDTGRVTGIPDTAGTYSVVLRATNTVNGTVDPCVFNNTVGTATATVIFAISPTSGAPAITSATVARGTETIPFVYGINATNSPTSYNVVGLPTGLTFDPATGVITGAPAINTANVVPYMVTITATNDIGSGSATLALAIDAPIPQITSSTSSQVTFSTELFQYQTVATTFTDPAITANMFSVVFTPLIPSGNLSISASTGLLSGTPAAADVGNYTARITVTNNRGSSFIDLPIFIVNQLLAPGSAPIVITSPLRAAAIVGCPFTYQIVAAGANCFGASFNGNPLLPGHLVIDNETGLISGTPQPADVGTFTIRLSAGVIIFGGCVTATQANLVLTILPAPVQPPNPDLTSPDTIGAVLGTTMTYAITTTPDFNDPTQFQLPLQFSASPVPQGLGLSPDKILALGQSNAVISGTASQIGTTNVRVTVLNSTGSDTKNVAFTVAPLTITSPLTASGTVGVPFTPYTIRSSGNPNVFNATGLPGGLTIDTRTGVISGIPTDTNVATPVDFPVTITTDNGFGTATATLVITIAPKPAGAPDINSALTQTAVDGISFTYQITTALNNATGYNASGFPTGLVFEPNTGTLQGSTGQIGTFNIIIVATNASGSDAETLVLTVNQAPPVITSATNVTIPLGEFFSYQITTSGSQPQQYSVTPLPAGFTLNGNVLSGTPTVPGVNPPVTLSASNQAASVSTSLTITVTQVPVFLQPTTATGVIGDAAFTFTVTAAGFPPPDLTVDPVDLPPGITFTPNASSGLLGSGTFTGPATAPGQFFIPVTATSIVGTTTQQVSITIAPPTITSPLTHFGVVNTALAPYTITSNGGPTTFTASPLPPGLTLNGATISGTPTAAGTTEVTITASNQFASASATLIIGISTVAGAPAISSSLLLTGTKNTLMSYAITANNNPTSFNATGLPAGLAVDTETGLINGTPTVSGSFPVTISAANAIGTGTATLLIAISDVAGGPAITSPLTATTEQLVDFTYQITSINGPIDQFGASNLPPGLVLDVDTGIISGQVAAGPGGVFNVAISATNSVATAQATLVLTVISRAATITSPLAVTSFVGANFVYEITATGVPTITFSTGALPSWLTFSGSTLSGVPPIEGSFTVDITASNALGTDTKTLVITIAPAPAMIISSLAVTGQVSVPFVYTIVASGTAPITYFTSELPQGLTLVGSTIAGVPAVAGVFTVHLTASNVLGTNEQDLIITIADKPDDSDGDGYPDEFEIAMGSDPFNPASTPLNGGAISDKRVISITTMQIRLNFTSTTKDNISLKGTIPTTGINAFTGPLTVVVGGIRKDFTLDARGNGKLGSDRFAARISTKLNIAKITAKFANSNYKPQLVDEQLTGAFNLKNVSRQVRVFILYGNTLFDSRKLLSYTVKANRTGTAKAAKVTQP